MGSTGLRAGLGMGGAARGEEAGGPSRCWERAGPVPRAPRRLTLGLGAGLLLAVASLLLRQLPWPEAAFLEQWTWRTRLLTPAELRNRLPLPRRLRRFLNTSRSEVLAVLEGRDSRLLAVVGPCSIHDPEAAREYARRLREVALAHRRQLLVLMRVYLEKPRTSIGWRGLINDPDLSGAEDIGRGLALGRRVLLDVNAAGLPTAVEFLEPLVAPYLEDLVAYGSIGARTVESPTHRALVAGLPMPVGFKNSRSGDLQSAINAARAAAVAQRRLSLDHNGRVRAEWVRGNPAGHVVLRGGEAGPNFDNASVAEAAEGLSRAGLHGRRVVVDCSHGNSGKRHEGQVDACRSVAVQVAEGSNAIAGVMIESFLQAGNQPFEPGLTPASELDYGLSITDACLDIDDTEALLGELAAAVESRHAGSWRQAVSGGAPEE